MPIAFAQSIAPEKLKASDEDKSNEVNDGTSSGNRKNLKYQMAVGIIGTEYIKTPITLSVGYFIHPDGILTLRFSTLNHSDKWGAYKMNAVTIGYRRFFGNSFNVMPTIYYKRNTADLYTEGAYPYVSGSNNLIYEDIGTGFRVGNEWQWKNFTMGCDWFGLNYKAVEINFKEKSLGPIDTHAPMKALTMTFASFYLGYSF